MLWPKIKDAIMTERFELTEAELEAVSGGFILDVIATVYGNAVYDALTSKGPVKGGVLDTVLNGLHIPH